MGEFAVGVVVLGFLALLSLAGRRPKDRDKAEQDERKAIERQGAIRAEGARLAEPKTPKEVADEVNKAFR